VGGGAAYGNVLDFLKILYDVQKGPWEVLAPKSSAPEGMPILSGAQLLLSIYEVRFICIAAYLSKLKNIRLHYSMGPLAPLRSGTLVPFGLP